MFCKTQSIQSVDQASRNVCWCDWII